MTVAPAAIESLFTDTQQHVPAAVLSGIVGDAAHSFGYHLSRNDLIARGDANDYSLTLPLDRLGPDDTASALDISLPPDLMITVTTRLLAAAKARDPRLRALREFCGTTDGQHTHPYDLSNGQDGPLDSWDSSHLWHVHLSFYRAYCTNTAALAPISDVIAGTPASTTAPVGPSPVEDDMFLLFTYQNAIWLAPLGLQYKRPFKDSASLQAWRSDAKALGAKVQIDTGLSDSTKAAIPTGATIA